MYLNKALIIGNLTRDPELRSLPSGIQVTTFSVATNRVWKDKAGARQETADYHNVVVFGRQAETANQYLKKGASVLVEGRMQTRSWDGQDGKKQYRTEVVADRVQFGPRAGGAGSYPQPSPSNQPTSSAPVQDDGGMGESIAYPDDEINPEDIPF